ncbi:site-specific integrase [Balneolaceae bacterium YR4-1]|uniref:Site-specific integrase n=1 Tax=Halalkalibaculum roseum TaxID=2709311 RepID=A0A6M1SSR4_9BACT|nr:site-specific integrase [Halalkalibaculum roseum]NGP75138.1 site-specific integrase [Halalkalibaculum roseum]
MATLNLYQKIRKGNDHHPVYLRITHNRRSRMVNLDIRISEDDWNAERGEVRRSHPNHTWLNNFLKAKKAEAQQQILKVRSRKSKGISVEVLKEAVEGKWQDMTNFFSFAEDIIADFEQQQKYNRKRNYKVVIGRLKEFWGKDTLAFSDLNLTFLRKFNVFLETKYGNNPNTRENYFKKIRKIFNDAIREGYVERSLYPFDQFDMPSAKSYKTKLSYEQIKNMASVELTKGQRQRQSRNIFVFAFYARGMRFRDAIQLKWKKIKNGRLVYRMSKTGQLVNMKLLPQMQKILDEHKPEEGEPDPEDFIFPFFEKEKDYGNKNFLDKQVSSKNSLINSNIKKVAKKAEITERVSFHVARHSFAYHCLTMGKDIFTIKDLLGHSDIKETLRYVKSLGADHLDKEVDDIF